jgi:hypothetical protein
MKAKFMKSTLREVKKDWKGTIVDRIRTTGKVLPIVSGSISNDLMFGNQAELVKRWAEYIEYPFPERDSLTHLTQYTSVMLKADPEVKADDVYIKEAYLDFLRTTLWEQADEDLREELEEDANLETMPFSKFAERLEFPRFAEENKDALLLLASLPLPIYVTTGYSDFVEAALIKAGKTPRSEICYWSSTLQSIPSVFQGGSYQPSVQEPLVYHLHGRDTHPASLVITEDDYLDFLVGISQDQGVLPLPVSRAFTDCSLLLLGYSLRSWDFRVLFRGLIKTSLQQLRTKSVCIQLPDDEGEKTYLQHYLDQEAELEVHWATAQEMLQELWQAYVSG